MSSVTAETAAARPIQHPFDPGPVVEPFVSLCREYPGGEVYPPEDFRVEWGPIFHRGRLDGSARVLVLGQDPAQHEAIARRILVGEAGQRVQAFLFKLGIEKSYVMINASLYSEARRGAAAALRDEAAIAYRNRWLDALLLNSQIEVVVAFGSLARRAFDDWRRSRPDQASDFVFEHVRHPTFPEGSSGGNQGELRRAMREMLIQWNEALARLHPAVAHPDVARDLVPYDVEKRAETVEIPERDLPAGMPPWMRSVEKWADREGSTREEKRATIVVTVPKGERPWPPLSERGETP